MILKPDRARHYVEKEVDWWTLVFFMLLFAVAGTLEHTHVDQVLANGFSKIAGSTTETLVPFIFIVSAFGSAFVDNVIFVAAFSPVIEQLSVNVKDLPLWWALLFGACFGGNITMIGSTANIVALGMLEKHGGSQISFFQWFKIGLLCTALSGAIAIGALLFLAPHMPDHKITFNKLAAGSGYVPVTETFTGELTGTIIRQDGVSYLTDGRGARIRVEFADGVAAEEQVKVRVSGEFAKDEANAEYPYMLTVQKLTVLEKD
jgi:di/tricarboxylate transporter